MQAGPAYALLRKPLPFSGYSRTGRCDSQLVYDDGTHRRARRVLVRSRQALGTLRGQARVTWVSDSVDGHRLGAVGSFRVHRLVAMGVGDLCYVFTLAIDDTRRCALTLSRPAAAALVIAATTAASSCTERR